MVIKDAIHDSKELVGILKKCKGIVSFFHRSASATIKLRRQQQRDSPDCEPLKLIGNVETRWNSEFDMLHRLLEVQHSINAVVGERRMPKNINSCEWSMINEYCKSLKIFKEAILLLTVEVERSIVGRRKERGVSLIAVWNCNRVPRCRRRACDKHISKPTAKWV